VYKEKSQVVKEPIEFASMKKKKEGIAGEYNSTISNRVLRCPVLSPLERLAADMAWNG